MFQMKPFHNLVAKLQDKAIDGLLTLLVSSPLISLALWENAIANVVSEIDQPWLTRLLFLLLLICLSLGTWIFFLLQKSKYDEEAGAVFKRKHGGGHSETPYCPKCHSAMFAKDRTTPFQCGNQKCGQVASFNKIHLGDVMERLP